jgi:hypothetical protein
VGMLSSTAFIVKFLKLKKNTAEKYGFMKKYLSGLILYPLTPTPSSPELNTFTVITRLQLIF